MDFKSIKADITVIKDIEDIKDVLNKIVDYVEGQENELSETDKESELLAERVSNIETCLDASNINTDNLRL